MDVGDQVKLLRPMLENEVGTIGYVYEEYPDFDEVGEFGVSVIFENGRYDGFSVWEQRHFLEYVKSVPQYQNYLFRNVNELHNDFKKNYWAF